MNAVDLEMDIPCDSSFVTENELLLDSKSPNVIIQTANSHDDQLSNTSAVRERCGSFTSSTTDDSGYSANSNPISSIPLLFEQQRSVRVFQTHDEFEWAMKEDLSDWLNTIYPQFNLTPDYFFEGLEDGILLCHHLTELQKCGEVFVKDKENREIPIKMGKKFLTLPAKAPHLDRLAKPGAVSFKGRDNLSNFLRWCKEAGMHSTMLFDTEDLIQRRHTRNILLCLLQIARIGSKFGMEVPELINLEQEIDAEMALDTHEEEHSISELHICPETQPCITSKLPGSVEVRPIQNSEEIQTTKKRSHSVIHTPSTDVIKEKEVKKSALVCDLKSLDEMVREIVSACQCENMVFMKRLAEGKYLIGEKSSLIFVRILRNHVMVRVGGGWDTLNHFLEKHDPCRKGKTCSHSRQSSVPTEESTQHFSDQGNFREGQIKWSTCRSQGACSAAHETTPPRIIQQEILQSSLPLETNSVASIIPEGSEECITPRNTQEESPVESSTSKTSLCSESSCNENKIQTKCPPKKHSINSPTSTRRVSSPQMSQKTGILPGSSKISSSSATAANKAPTSRSSTEKSLNDKLHLSREDLLKTYPSVNSPRTQKVDHKVNTSKSHSNTSSLTPLSTSKQTSARSAKGFESPKLSRPSTSTTPSVRNRSQTSVGTVGSPAMSPVSSPSMSRRVVTRNLRASSDAPSLPIKEYSPAPSTKKSSVISSEKKSSQILQSSSDSQKGMSKLIPIRNSDDIHLQIT